MTADSYMTSSDAADILGVSTVTVARWVRQGILHPSDRLTAGRGVYLFDPDEVRQLAKTRPGSQVHARAGELRRAADAITRRWPDNPVAVEIAAMLTERADTLN